MISNPYEDNIFFINNLLSFQITKAKNSKTKIVFPFQGEHYQEIREEGIAFIQKEKENMAGVYICGIFDESEIVNDSILAKRSSKFHNYYKKKSSKDKKSEQKKMDEKCQWKQKEKEGPREVNTKEETSKSEISKPEVLKEKIIEEKSEDKEKSKEDGQSLADILKNRTRPSATGSKKGKSNNTADFQSTYNFANRKMVYEMLSKALSEESQPTSQSQMPKPEASKFNDLNGLLSTQPPAILLSSDGEFFKVLEGAWFGAQGFQAGYPFEVSKHQMVIHIDFKRWILLLRLFLKEDHALKSSVSSEYFLNWVKSHDAKSLEDLVRKIGVSEEAGEGLSLGKRGDCDFDGGKIISRSLQWAQILMSDPSVDSKIYSLENAGGIMISLC